MRKIIFLITHKGSGHEELASLLSSHPSIDTFVTGSTYAHFDDFLSFTKLPHKKDNVSSIFLDTILENHQLPKTLLHIPYKLIYLLNPFPGVDEIRVRGILEYHRRTPYFPLIRGSFSGDYLSLI